MAEDRWQDAVLEGGPSGHSVEALQFVNATSTKKIFVRRSSLDPQPIAHMPPCHRADCKAKSPCPSVSLTVLTALSERFAAPSISDYDFVDRPFTKITLFIGPNRQRVTVGQTPR